MLLALAALLTASLSSPDLILPGHHGVTHELVVETAPDVEDWRLFAAPTAGFGGLHEVVDGEPFSFSSKYGTRFYAIPDGEQVPEFLAPFDRDEEPELGARWDAFPSCEPPVSEVRSVPEDDPVQHILTSLRWVGVDGEGPTLEVIGERRTGSSGEVLEGLGGRPGPAPTPSFSLYLVALVVLGIVGLAVILSRGYRS